MPRSPAGVSNQVRNTDAVKRITKNRESRQGVQARFKFGDTLQVADRILRQ